MSEKNMTNVFKCDKCGDTLRTIQPPDVCFGCEHSDGYCQVDSQDHTTIVKHHIIVKAELKAKFDKENKRLQDFVKAHAKAQDSGDVKEVQRLINEKENSD